MTAKTQKVTRVETQLKELRVGSGAAMKKAMPPRKMTEGGGGGARRTISESHYKKKRNRWKTASRSGGSRGERSTEGSFKQKLEKR